MSTLQDLGESMLEDKKNQAFEMLDWDELRSLRRDRGLRSHGPTLDSKGVFYLELSDDSRTFYVPIAYVETIGPHAKLRTVDQPFFEDRYL